MTTHEKLEEILGMAFVGLYAKQLSSNGMGFEFVDLYDTYDVLKADLKKDIEALIDQARKEGAIEELERLKGIDCFNEPFTWQGDKRPGKFVDIRIKALKGE